MVTAASDNATVGAYAAKDNAGNLTLLLVNNSTTGSTTDIIDALLTAQYYVGLVPGWPS